MKQGWALSAEEEGRHRREFLKSGPVVVVFVNPLTVEPLLPAPSSKVDP
jgi:hypothetical protein